MTSVSPQTQGTLYTSKLVDRTGQDVAVQVLKLMHREKLMREHTSRGSSRGMQLGLAAEIAQSYFWFWLGLAGCF